MKPIFSKVKILFLNAEGRTDEVTLEINGAIEQVVLKGSVLKKDGKTFSPLERTIFSDFLGEKNEV